VADAVAGSELVFPVRRPAGDGVEAWREVVERGYEGLVAKDENSAYESGPTRRWLKIKQKGWTDPADRWRRQLSIFEAAADWHRRDLPTRRRPGRARNRL
jgi:ATP-dependent DNA ligase